MMITGGGQGRMLLAMVTVHFGGSGPRTCGLGRIPHWGRCGASETLTLCHTACGI